MSERVSHPKADMPNHLPWRSPSKPLPSSKWGDFVDRSEHRGNRRLDQALGRPAKLKDHQNAARDRHGAQKKNDDDGRILGGKKTKAPEKQGKPEDQQNKKGKWYGDAGLFHEQPARVRNSIQELQSL